MVDVIGNARPAIIGDNVFIGMGTFIIGVNSTVSGIIPDDCVAAGNLASLGFV